MPKLKNLAALAAAVEAGRRYARKNPDKAGRYVDQAAAFLDKQTKGKYSGQIDGVVGKVKGAAGLPPTPRTTQGFAGDPAYGRSEGYGRTAPVSPPVTPSTTAPTATTPTTGPTTPTTGPAATTPPPTAAGSAAPPVTTPHASSGAATVDPEGVGDAHFPGSRDV